jgi:5S rRNA maturation endonuclease (ribonuclease M5)
MDYIFFKSIARTELARFFVSYDIACQWHLNILVRMLGYENEEITIDGRGKFLTFLVPKFHLPAHIEACNLKYSFNLTPYVGQTDGEAPERGWSEVNPLARSTKEMGPGSRRDALDDHFNDGNHKKIVRLGASALSGAAYLLTDAFFVGHTLRRKMVNAVPEMGRTRLALSDQEELLETETVEEWTAMAEQWEADVEAKNPFETHRKDTHLAKVRAELAAEAAKREVEGKEDVADVKDDMHITELIAMGLQLEEQQ